MLGLIDASEDQSADGLTEIMLKTLQKYRLVPETSGEKLIGQSYDGAATMSGELNGVQRQVQRHFPSAYYNQKLDLRTSEVCIISVPVLGDVLLFQKTPL